MGLPATLRVDIVSDARGVGPGVDQASSKFSKLGKVGAAALKGIAVAGAAAVAGAIKLGAMAAEDEASQARLATALRNTTGARRRDIDAVESWITKQGEALGVADDELRPALSKLAAATGDVGKAQRLASLAMDVSAGTGKSLSQVTDALVRAQNGSVTGLSRLGIATKNQAGETLSLDKITGKLADTYRGQAATAANTTAGKFDRLKLRLSEVAEGIGARLLPLGNKLLSWALKIAPKVEALAGAFARELGPAFRTIGSFIMDRLVPAGRTLFTWFVEKLAPGIRRYLSPILDGARKAFDKVRDAVDRNRPQIEKLVGVVKAMVEFYVNKVLPVIGKGVGKAFEVAGKAIAGAIDVISRLVGWVEDAVDAVQNLIDWIQRIDVPDFDLPGFGSRGREPVTAGRPTTSTSTSTSSSSSAPGVTNIYVSGAIDPIATARQIQALLREDVARRGGTIVLGGVTP